MARKKRRRGGDGRGKARVAKLKTPAEPSSSLLSRGTLVLLFVLAALLAFRKVASPDIGFHLKAGEFLIEHHRWPRLDPFSYTMESHPYIDTSWGFQLLVAILFRLGGAHALVAANVAAILAVLAVVHASMRLFAGEEWLRHLILLVSIMACEIRFEVRPEVGSWLFLVIELHLLYRYWAGRPTRLALLPLIQFVWVNVHALSVLGLVAMAGFLAGGLLARRRLDRRLAAALSASVAVSLVNPYGLRGALFPLELATRLHRTNLFASSIGEFTSPFSLDLGRMFPFFPVVSLGSLWLFTALCLLTLPSLVRNSHVPALILGAAFFLLCSRMIRNVPLFVLVMAPPVSGLVQIGAGRSGPPRRWRSLVPPLVFLTALGFAARVVTNAHYIATRRQTRFGSGMNRAALPVDAAAYLVRAGFRGRFLNHINLGGYLMWGQPTPVFIDGRLEVVGEEFYERYRYIMGSLSHLSEAREIYGFDLVILPYRIAPRLVSELARSPDWRLVYLDPVCCIYQAKGSQRPLSPEIPPEIEAFERDETPGLDGPPRQGRFRRFVSGFVRRERFPVQSFNQGLFFLFAGDLGRAERSFRQAIRESGGRYYESYNNLGSVLYRQHRLREALACYEIVLAERPQDPVARERVASIRSGMN